MELLPIYYISNHHDQTRKGTNSSIKKSQEPFLNIKLIIRIQNRAKAINISTNNGNMI